MCRDYSAPLHAKDFLLLLLREPPLHVFMRGPTSRCYLHSGQACAFARLNTDLSLTVNLNYKVVVPT
jgi:hypothetical protein